MLADFHNHSCLSPCASLAMSPRRMARTAAAAGIGIMALTDHNSARNTPAFAAACREAGILSLCGLEITTAEECHVLALFDDPEAALDMGAWVWNALPDIPLDPVRFGDQPVVDEQENIIEMIDRLLTAAIGYTLSEIEQETHRRGGLFIPAHINRPAFSVESQLGFLPPGHYDAIEVLSPQATGYQQRYPHIPVITSSDAHIPEHIARAPFSLDLSEPTIPAIRQALYSNLSIAT
jgi:3',5'-nucleoside bisphosphate phosphatase